MDISEVLTASLIRTGYMHRVCQCKALAKLSGGGGHNNISYAGNVMGPKGTHCLPDHEWIYM